MFRFDDESTKSLHNGTLMNNKIDKAMRNNTAFYILLGIWGLMWATGLYFEPQLPEQMATHWNSKGDADGFMGKTAGIVFLPVLCIIFLFMHRIIPLADPKKFAKGALSKYFHLMFIVLMLFMYVIYLYGLLYNIGYQIDISKIMPLGLGILMYVIALMVRHTEPNIPNPQKADPRKVEAFQKNVSMAFKLTAICVSFGFFFPEYMIWLTLVPIGITTVYTVFSAFRL